MASELTHRLSALLSVWPRKTITTLLFNAASPRSELATGELERRLKDLDAKRARKMRQAFLISDMPQDGDLQAVGYFDEDFPAALRAIPDPPLILFYRGDISWLGARCIAIVGARRATSRGRSFARALALRLATYDIHIVSGLAYGIDAAAHEGALVAGGLTSAFLGSGLNNLYPASHHGLARRIVRSGGALFSEYSINQRPQPWQFPERNRLISGLSNGVIVVEAGAKSGSLITARLALEQGRDVFAVPGLPDSAVSEGCHRLIRDGAELVTNVQDVMQSLGFARPPPYKETESVAASVESLSSLQSQIRQAIYSASSCSVDELIAITGLPVNRVATEVARLEIMGFVRRGADGYIATSKE